MEDDISREKDLSPRPIDGEGARGMAGCPKNFKTLFAQAKLPFPEIEIDSEFRQRLIHGLKEKSPTLSQIPFLFLCHGNPNRFFEKGLGSLQMVWMGMGDEDKIDLFRIDSIPFHLKEDAPEVAGMAGVDEKGEVFLDHIGITIVFIGILPEIGVEALFELHGFFSG
jgi:hypothetical protein